MPVILATQEAEIWRSSVQSQPGQIVCENLSRKTPSQKEACGVALSPSPSNVIYISYFMKIFKIIARKP
jgi:hypothetical protein